jgi:hypothetical protein
VTLRKAVAHCWQQHAERRQLGSSKKSKKTKRTNGTPNGAVRSVMTQYLFTTVQNGARPFTTASDRRDGVCSGLSGGGT